MGTKVQSKSYLPGYYSMRDLNEDSNGCSWPLFYSDKSLANEQYYNGFWSSVTADAYPGYDKDVVKRTMIAHETIFKNQVYELHRLYRTQRDLMNEIQRKELHRNRTPMETSLSSSPLASQITSEDARKWHNHSFAMVNSMCARPSVLGVDGIHSPLSSMKGNCTQTGLFPSQSGCSSKDIEVLESRPTKVRRKMFDLQLPADEYIDTEEGEQLSDEKVSAISSNYSNRNCKFSPENGVKFFVDDSSKNDSKAALKSDTCLKRKNSLADLNEPIQLEEIRETNSTSYDFRNGKIQDFGQSTKPNSHLLGLPKEISVNSYGSDSGTKNNLHLQNNGNGSRWFPHVLEAGQRNSNLHSISQSLQTEKLPLSSQSNQVSPKKIHEPLFYLSDKSKADLWREKTVCGVEISERSTEYTNNRQIDSFVISHVPNPYEIMIPDLGKPWPHPWEKSSNSFCQKSISAQTFAGLKCDPTLSRNSQASVKNDGIFGDRWYINCNTRPNHALGSEFPYKNGFYQGSSSGSKDVPVRIPSVSGDYLSCSNENNNPPGHLTSDGSAKGYKGLNCMDMKSTKDMNLNVAISDCSSNQETPLRGNEILGTEQKHEDHLAVLPWLRSKPACKTEASDFRSVSKSGEMSIFQPSNNQSAKSEIINECNQLFGQNVKSLSSATDAQARKIEISDYPSSRKLLGFPIFEKSHITKDDSSSLTSLSVSLQKLPESKVVNNRNRVLDINLPCDPTAPELAEQNEEEILVVERGMDSKTASFRHHIDLNSCLSDDEDSVKPSAPTNTVKFTAEIDLEAVPESEDDYIHGEASVLTQNEAQVTLSKDEVAVPQDELMMVAAEAIVAISSSGCPNHADDSCSLSEFPSKESNLTDPLRWFVEIISSCGDDLEGKIDTVLRVRDDEDSDDYLEEIDFFESMILNLSETKEEDYMPKPLVPENLKLEETGTSVLSNRPRKGQARRGRQRRDFQRDILPGLASLSRHEVTEDLQTFGGLMRASGHCWNAGLTRRNSTRNGSGRGRRRSVVSPSPPAATSPSCTPMVSNIEMGLEDRSLTGWGKTTRRPRRQRCPAGNPPSIPLT